MNLSFKYRIAGYYLFTTTLIIALLFLVIYWIVHNTVYSYLEEDLHTELTQIIGGIAIGNDNKIGFLNPSEWKEGEHSQIEVNPTFIQVVDSEGNILKKSPNLFGDSLKFYRTFSSKYFFRTELSKSSIYQLQSPVHNKSRETVAYVLIAVPLENAEIVIVHLRNVLLISLPLILFILFFVTRYIAGKAIVPVNIVIQTANRITKENLQERIKLPNNKDEIYTLISTINELLDRLEDTLLREKQFTSDASHELRTPLSVIKGTLEVLVRKPREVSQYEEKINYCIKETDRMTKLIDQLLFLAKYDSGKFLPNKSRIDIRKLIDNVIRRLEPIILEKEIRVNIKNDSVTVAVADESMMEIIFENVIINSIKYSNSNSQIDVKFNDKVAFLECTIKDNGLGMTEEQSKKIFDRFYRTDESRNSEAGGFGLGLSIVKKFCELQEIDLSVESKLSAGTSFTFLIKK